MILVRVASIAIDARGQHVLLLKPVADGPGEGRVLPIWIGEQESMSILIAVEGAESPRPLSHDLMKSLIEAVGAQPERVEVTRIENGTYYAELTLQAQGRDLVLDCRPSDAIALASRLEVPLWVADEVMVSSAIDDEFTGGTDDDEDESLEEFRKFLDEVDPEDFQG